MKVFQRKSDEDYLMSLSIPKYFEAANVTAKHLKCSNRCSNITVLTSLEVSAIVWFQLLMRFKLRSSAKVADTERRKDKTPHQNQLGCKNEFGAEFAPSVYPSGLFFEVVGNFDLTPDEHPQM
jgi:hypothetical protein